MTRRTTSPILLLTLGLLTGCDPAPPSAPAPIQAQRDLSRAERRAVFEKAEAARERNSKVTRRPRRFTEDSL